MEDTQATARTPTLLAWTRAAVLAGFVACIAVCALVGPAPVFAQQAATDSSDAKRDGKPAPVKPIPIADILTHADDDQRVIDRANRMVRERSPAGQLAEALNRIATSVSGDVFVGPGLEDFDARSIRDSILQDPFYASLDSVGTALPPTAVALIDRLPGSAALGESPVYDEALLARASREGVDPGSAGLAHGLLLSPGSEFKVQSSKFLLPNLELGTLNPELPVRHHSATVPSAFRHTGDFQSWPIAASSRIAWRPRWMRRMRLPGRWR